MEKARDIQDVSSWTGDTGRERVTWASEDGNIGTWKSGQGPSGWGTEAETEGESIEAAASNSSSTPGQLGHLALPQSGQVVPVSRPQGTHSSHVGELVLAPSAALTGSSVQRQGWSPAAGLNGGRTSVVSTPRDPRLLLSPAQTPRGCSDPASWRRSRRPPAPIPPAFLGCGCPFPLGKLEIFPKVFYQIT